MQQVQWMEPTPFIQCPALSSTARLTQRQSQSLQNQPNPFGSKLHFSEGLPTVKMDLVLLDGLKSEELFPSANMKRLYSPWEVTLRHISFSLDPCNFFISSITITLYDLTARCSRVEIRWDEWSLHPIYCWLEHTTCVPHADTDIMVYFMLEDFITWTLMNEYPSLWIFGLLCNKN